jgi:shikimate kinase
MKIKKYFITGMPASGKSTIGRLVARQLSLDFFDLDEIIVEKEGAPITDIFEKHGESYFRILEQVCLKEFISGHENFLLATGGGTPCFFDNMELMNKNGITIFLNVDIEDLYKKLSAKGIQKRPLLKDKSEELLLEELKLKFEQRKDFYLMSKICLDQHLTDIPNRANQVIFAIKTLEK